MVAVKIGRPDRDATGNQAATQVIVASQKHPGRRRGEPHVERPCWTPTVEQRRGHTQCGPRTDRFQLGSRLPTHMGSLQQKAVKVHGEQAGRAVVEPADTFARYSVTNKGRVACSGKGPSLTGTLRSSISGPPRAPLGQRARTLLPSLCLDFNTRPAAANTELTMAVTCECPGDGSNRYPIAAGLLRPQRCASMWCSLTKSPSPQQVTNPHRPCQPFFRNSRNFRYNPMANKQCAS